MKFLLTAFEPFGGRLLNASTAAIYGLSELGVDDDTQVELMTLPVRHQVAGEMLCAKLAETQADVVLCFGEAGGRAKISLERIAINYGDFSIPDNSGILVCDEALLGDAPAAYFSTLPLRSLESVLLAAGIPVEISLSAGSYLCNEVFYLLMHTLAASKMDVMGGFIHLPILPVVAAESKSNLPSMSVSETQRGILLIMQEIKRVLERSCT